MATDVNAQPDSTGSPPEATPDSTEGEVESFPPADADLPLDQVFEILRNQRRRHVLRILRESDEPVRIGELAEQIAAWENGKEPHEITSSERKRVYVGLYQAHLPKMDGMDVIAFNKPRGIIEPAENIGAFDEYIVPDEGRGTLPWHVYYASISAGSVVLLLVAFLLRSQVAFPVVEWILAIVVVAFAACSAGNVWWVRRSADAGATPN